MSDLRQIEMWRGDEPLRDACGQTLRLQGTGPNMFTWSPRSKRALDLELRVLPVSALNASEVIPVWRYRLEFGHGDSLAKVPTPAQGIVPLAPTLPHRGLLVRLSARELRVVIWTEEALGGPVPDESQIEVSAQPSFGAAGWPSVTYQDTVTVTTSPRRLPIEAREFQVRDLFAQPYAIGAASVQFSALTGAPFGLPFDAADLYDWQPIPTLAAFYALDVPGTVAFR